MKKEKFALQTKIGQVVYRVEINLRSGLSKKNSCGLYEDGIHVEALKIVYQTTHKIALSDKFISLLDRQHEGQKKESCRHYFNDILVNVKTKETYWPNGIFASCITTEDPERCVKKMKRKIIETIGGEYGFLISTKWVEQIENMQITTL